MAGRQKPFEALWESVCHATGLAAGMALAKDLVMSLDGPLTMQTRPHGSPASLRHGHVDGRQEHH